MTKSSGGILNPVYLKNRWMRLPRKRKYISENVLKGISIPFPFVIEMIKSLANAECRLAVVSSATIENIRYITEELGHHCYYLICLSPGEMLRWANPGVRDI